MKIQHSSKISVLKLIFLSLLTMGIYHLYWFYKNWKFIKQNYKEDISPGWRTVGLIIPILNIFLIYNQFKSIIEIVKRKKIEINWSAGLLTFLYVFIEMIFLFGPEKYFILFAFLIPIGTLPLIPVQNCLNRFFDLIEKKSAKTKFATGEIILTIIGIILWISIILGIASSDYATSLTEESLEEIKSNIVWIKYDAIVKNLDGFNFETSGSGSGVIVLKKDNLLNVLTNRHVLTCQFNNETCHQVLNQTIKIRTYDGEIYTSSNFSMAPYNLDMALLEFKVSNQEKYSSATLRTSPIVIGEKVIAIGYPSFAKNVLEYSFSEGRVLWSRDLLTDEGFSFKAIDSDAYTYFGSSGGGLFDMNGDLVGINTWGSIEEAQRSIAIDINFINELIKKRDSFIFCEQGSYIGDKNNCIPYCQKDEILGSDNKCYSVCKDYYCGSDEYKIKKEKECPTGYVSLDGVYCERPPCGSPTTYCESAQYCFENQCISCPYPRQLFKDGTCRYIDSKQTF